MSVKVSRRDDARVGDRCHTLSITIPITIATTTITRMSYSRHHTCNTFFSFCPNKNMRRKMFVCALRTIPHPPSPFWTQSVAASLSRTVMNKASLSLLDHDWLHSRLHFLERCLFCVLMQTPLFRPLSVFWENFQLSGCYHSVRVVKGA